MVKAKSVIWQLFSKYENSIFVRCNLCQQDYKSSGNTSNLFDHAKRKHPIEFKRLKQTDEMLSDEDSESEGTATPPENPVTVKKRRATLKNYFNRVHKYSNVCEKKKKLDRLLVNMISTDLEPFSIVEHVGFQRFVRELDNQYELPSRSHLKDKMFPDSYGEIKIKVQELLGQVDSVALTTDMWTSLSNEGIMTLTCHFVHNAKLKSAVLRTVKMEGHHTGVNISKVNRINLFFCKQ